MFHTSPLFFLDVSYLPIFFSDPSPLFFLYVSYFLTTFNVCFILPLNFFYIFHSSPLLSLHVSYLPTIFLDISYLLNYFLCVLYTFPLYSQCFIPPQNFLSLFHTSKFSLRISYLPTIFLHVSFLLTIFFVSLMYSHYFLSICHAIPPIS